MPTAVSDLPRTPQLSASSEMRTSKTATAAWHVRSTVTPLSALNGKTRAQGTGVCCRFQWRCRKRQPSAGERMKYEFSLPWVPPLKPNHLICRVCCRKIFQLAVGFGEKLFILFFGTDLFVLLLLLPLGCHFPICESFLFEHFSAACLFQLLLPFLIFKFFFLCF